MDDPGLYELLQAMRRLTLDSANQLGAAAAGGGSGGSGGVSSGERDPPSFVLDYHGDANPDGGLALYAADTAAADMYVRSGEWTTSRNRTQFNKHMQGHGQFILTDRATPANYGFMPTKPTTFPQQGVTGWFRGDQWFTDGGEWKVIGPDVRTYDLNARYFESNVIPHHAWWEVESGNSGVQAYIPGGVTPGSSVTLTYNGSPEWVGKDVQIRQTFGGAVLATLKVLSVVGTVVNFTAAHGVTCPWNPAAGNAPNLSFAPRTWGGYKYILVRAKGGGDVYGHLVRMNIEYQPKQNELTHAYNGVTGGQYGGSVDFISLIATLSVAASTGSAVVSVGAMSATQAASMVGKRAAIRPFTGGPVIDLRRVVSATTTTITMDSPPSVAHPAGSVISAGPDGAYATGWESMYYDNGCDVSVIAQVDSFVRLNDRADQGGRVWIGTRFASSGRPADAAHVVAGPWRRGLDTAGAALMDGSYLVLPAVLGATTISVKWAAGARKDHLVRLTYGPNTYTGTITNVTGVTLTVTPGLNVAYPVNTLVDFLDGGAAVAMKLGQWINWDASVDVGGRASDPLQVWGPNYSNMSGVIWSGADNDGSGLLWQTQVGDGRIRLRSNSLNTNVPFAGASSIAAALDLVTGGSSANANWQGHVGFGIGSGERLVFNLVTNKFEFYINDALVFSVP
jgi:hypothetical protein